MTCSLLGCLVASPLPCLLLPLSPGCRGGARWKLRREWCLRHYASSHPRSTTGRLVVWECFGGWSAGLLTSWSDCPKIWLPAIGRSWTKCWLLTVPRNHWQIAQQLISPRCCSPTTCLLHCREMHPCFPLCPFAYNKGAPHVLLPPQTPPDCLPDAQPPQQLNSKKWWL